MHDRDVVGSSPSNGRGGDIGVLSELARVLEAIEGISCSGQEAALRARARRRGPVPRRKTTLDATQLYSMAMAKERLPKPPPPSLTAEQQRHSKTSTFSRDDIDPLNPLRGDLNLQSVTNARQEQQLYPHGLSSQNQTLEVSAVEEGSRRIQSGGLKGPSTKSPDGDDSRPLLPSSRSALTDLILSKLQVRFIRCY